MGKVAADLLVQRGSAPLQRQHPHRRAQQFAVNVLCDCKSRRTGPVRRFHHVGTWLGQGAEIGYAVCLACPDVLLRRSRLPFKSCFSAVRLHHFEGVAVRGNTREHSGFDRLRLIADLVHADAGGVRILFRRHG